MSESCPNCGAPEWEDAYVQGEVWKCGNGHTNYTSAMCEYAAGLRAERDEARASSGHWHAKAIRYHGAWQASAKAFRESEAREQRFRAALERIAYPYDVSEPRPYQIAREALDESPAESTDIHDS